MTLPSRGQRVFAMLQSFDQAYSVVLLGKRTNSIKVGSSSHWDSLGFQLFRVSAGGGIMYHVSARMKTPVGPWQFIREHHAPLQLCSLPPTRTMRLYAVRLYISNLYKFESLGIKSSERGIFDRDRGNSCRPWHCERKNTSCWQSFDSCSRMNCAPQGVSSY